MAFSFGAPASTSQQGTAAQPSTGGFSFGNASTSQPQQPQQQQPSTSGFSFGSSNQQQQQPNAGGATGTTGGFSFGQPQQQQQAGQQSSTATTSGGFGSGLFGGGGGASSSLNQSQAPKPSGFSFGNSTTQQQPQQQNQSQSQQQQNQLGQSQFGVSQLGTSTSGQQQQQQQQSQQQDKRLGASLNQKMEAVRLAWDTNNLQTCRFMTYFYNNIPQGIMPPAGPAGAGGGGPFESNPNFGRRQDAVGPVHDALWERASRENPDRTRLVPVLAIGFPDLKTRLTAQEGEATRQSSHLKTINERISALEQKHSLSDSVRTSAAMKRQAALHHRIVSIARKSHVLIPSLRGTSVTKEEEALRSKLEACEAELESAGGSDGSGLGGSGSGATSGRLRARVNELWSMLGAVKTRREMLEQEGRKPSVEWAVVDERGVEEVANILAQQQQGLNHLIATLEEDSRALDTVLQGLKGVQLIGTVKSGAGLRGATMA
ncbi:hypothetical protein BCV69DRAFT_19733 [Microstroma glucosiphilum]|uniref:Nucleoporin Nup54 alpha-helical domain-containing protein n=1 Tax=Pseudomicrostroma glucosiphilum TaxID=1684307 RepID=A0A316UJF2_9BASI|nr:hypothetical protein BCV69DRAFT_19733 [Pseudomicrostroma glucosiphilum]PWN24083.1 hypothetical protein BCV69DRAFT_19733 [Pseudomicrostroma glucosiphilum]